VRSAVRDASARDRCGRVGLRNRRSEVRILSGALPDSADRAHLQGLRSWRSRGELVIRKFVSDSGRFLATLATLASLGYAVWADAVRAVRGRGRSDSGALFVARLRYPVLGQRRHLQLVGGGQRPLLSEVAAHRPARFRTGRRALRSLAPAGAAQRAPYRRRRSAARRGRYARAGRARARAGSCDGVDRPVRPRGARHVPAPGRGAFRPAPRPVPRPEHEHTSRIVGHTHSVSTNSTECREPTRRDHGGNWRRPARGLDRRPGRVNHPRGRRPDSDSTRGRRDQGTRSCRGARCAA
jgi:hypothetical protein